MTKITPLKNRVAGTAPNLRGQSSFEHDSSTNALIRRYVKSRAQR